MLDRCHSCVPSPTVADHFWCTALRYAEHDAQTTAAVWQRAHHSRHLGTDPKSLHHPPSREPKWAGLAPSVSWSQLADPPSEALAALPASALREASSYSLAYSGHTDGTSASPQEDLGQWGPQGPPQCRSSPRAPRILSSSRHLEEQPASTNSALRQTPEQLELENSKRAIAEAFAVATNAVAEVTRSLRGRDPAELAQLSLEHEWTELFAHNDSVG